MSVEVGQIIDGKYKVLRAIGEGGMGAVYEAEHIVIGRKVAVKVLHAHVAEQGQSVIRFEREAQAAARIGNDHILEVFDVGSFPDGARYMVCEYLDGETLSSRLEQKRRLTPSELVPLAFQLLRGLDAAHAAGVVHRDLKPDNIFLLKEKTGWSDFVKIIDFGISKFHVLAGEAGMKMTATGIVMGTSYYLSPEQARGTEEVDHRSDLYTVGVILYEAATGQLPFSAANFNDLLFKIVLQKPCPPIELVPDMDPVFSELILKGMARERGERFQTAGEFLRALEGWARQAGLVVTGPRLSVTPEAQMSDETHGAAPSKLTPGAWGGTQPTGHSPLAKKTRTSHLIVGVAVTVGVFALAGVGFSLYSTSSGSEISAASAEAVSATSARPPQTALAPPDVVEKDELRIPAPLEATSSSDMQDAEHEASAKRKNVGQRTRPQQTVSSAGKSKPVLEQERPEPRSSPKKQNTAAAEPEHPSLEERLGF